MNTTSSTRRGLRRIGIGVAVLVVLLVGVLWWLLGTTSGLHFALARVVAATDGAVSVTAAKGTLAGPLQLDGLRYHDATSGLDARIRHVTLDVSLWSLAADTARIDNLDADGITVSLPATRSSTGSSTPLSLKPPLDIVLKRVHIGDVHILDAGKSVFVATSLDVAGAWTSHGLTLKQLALKSPQGHADLAGEVALAKGYRGQGHGDFAWQLDGNTWAGSLKTDSDGHHAHLALVLSRPLKATLTLALEQRGAFPWTAKLDAPTFSAKPLLGDSSIKQLAIALAGKGDRTGGTLTGRINLNDTPLELAPLTLHYAPKTQTITLDQLALTSLRIKGALDAHGTISLAGKTPTADLVLNWHDVVLPKDLAGQELASNGQLTASGSADSYQAKGRITLGPPGQPAHLAIDAHGTPQRVTLEHLTIEQPKGHLDAQGTVTLTPQLAWDLTLKGQHFNPGLLLADWPGSLDIDLATQGQITPQGPQAEFDLTQLAGSLRQRTLAGKGKLKLSNTRVLNGNLTLASGHSRIALKATGTTRNHATLDLAIITLNDWLPNANGALHGTVTVDGLWPKLSVKAHLDGQKLAIEDQRIGRLNLVANIPDISHPGGQLKLTADKLFTNGLAFDSIQLTGSGDAARHNVSLTAKGQPLSLQANLSGGLQGKAWNGTLSTLDLDMQGLPTWHLKQPAQLAWNNGQASLSQTCLSSGVPTLCVAGAMARDGSLKANYSLTQMPLQLVTTLAEAGLPLHVEGVINGEGQMTMAADGQLSGHATLASPKGSIAYPDHPELPLAAYDNLAIAANFTPGSRRATLSATLAHGGYLKGDVVLTGTQQALSGQVAVRMDSLAPVELFTNALANLKGRLDAKFNVGGTLADPAINGQAHIEQFAAEVPAVGLKLHDGDIAVATTTTHQLSVNGKIGSGTGTLAITGVVGLDDNAGTQVRIRGDKVLAADIPAAKVTVSPDLTIDYGAKGLAIGGSVSIDDARVELEKLPGAGATQASPDVVVVDAKKKAAQNAGLPMTVNLTANLGHRTHIIGYGLDGRVSGSLNVRQEPGKTTTGRGQITVNGTFKAYGQDLTIKQGKLLFASTPIDNPGLDIRAIRVLHPNATISDGQEVGLAITGTAQRPVMNVFSNPPMEQSDALSYLITGKPLSAVQGGEGSMVDAAAQALGSAAGDLLAKGIGSKLGVDAGVSNSAALGTAAFTVGKYLSPRLYLSYGVGLFDPGQVITLRYLLSHRWNFEAEQATEFSRASFNYRIER
ncbi:MAG TPA: translocation/assembly module TamB domain-containing protein [Rhodanobacteraceae bacterium]